MRYLKLALLLTLGVMTLVGCSGPEPAPEPAPAPAPVEEAPASVSASAALASRADMTVSGTVTFTQGADGGPVTITASISGAPAGTHGLHIHEIGDCSSEDFKSSGGHFNPAEVPHGGPADYERHSGDLGNIEIGEDGSGSLELSSDLITLAPGEATSINGRAVVLHEGADDLESQPTGAAGGRIGCGVIGA